MSSNGKGLKRRVWPPTSTSTDTDSDESGDAVTTCEGQEETQNQSGPAAIIPPASPAGPEDAMKGLFDQLLQSMTKRSEQRLAELLPQVIEAKLGTHVRPIVEKELQKQLGDILSQEYLASLIQPLLAQTVPTLIKKELLSCEPIIRQAVADLAKPSIGEHVDRLVREQVESGVHQYLPAVVREQVGTIDQLVKDELHQAVSKQAPILADDLVRATAKDSVEQAVLRIVPDVAEQHVKAELKRLLEPDERSASSHA